MSTLDVRIDYADGIKDTQALGKQDPYCVVQVGPSSSRCRTCTDGGTKPVWNETLRFNNADFDNEAIITIKNENVMQTDDVIGTARVSLQRVKQVGSESLQVPVMSASGKQKGFLQISMTYYAQASASAPSSDGHRGNPAYSSPYPPQQQQQYSPYPGQQQQQPSGYPPAATGYAGMQQPQAYTPTPGAYPLQQQQQASYGAPYPPQQQQQMYGVPAPYPPQQQQPPTAYPPGYPGAPVGYPPQQQQQQPYGALPTTAAATDVRGACTLPPSAAAAAAGSISSWLSWCSW
eukprot:GHRQ01025244.1.p1 GENE.GHRQ01025244.1~~GHRQ01025244.1.p1  ORF type:complete len:290 (+),score=74.13 GHRQ01025244.1:521-1390(+)